MKSMSPWVSVVIANWNGRHYLEKCLESLAAQTYPAVEVIVVDNGSTDGSAAWVAERFPSVRLIVNPDNRGFAAANNQGVRQSRGAYVATLNNDTWVEPDWLAGLVAALERDPRLGMAASHMLFADQPEVINSTGICLDRCGISWDRHGGQTARQAEAGPAEVFGPCAGAALYRRELLEAVGLFDEDFFAYLEDVDLAWRARWRGWKAIYVPSARVYHIHSATSQEGSPFKTYWLSRNKIQMIAKNYPMPYLLLFLPLIVFYEFVSLGHALLSRRGSGAARGRLAGLRSLPRAFKKRRALWLRPHVPPAEIFGSLEPAAAPWQVYGRYRHIDRRLVKKAAVGYWVK
jgi:GT2 family glycosyltransferase